MIRTSKLRFTAALVILSVFATTASSLQARQAKSKALELEFKQAQRAVEHENVTISDVMEIRGGTQKLRKVAGKQDLEILSNLESTKITQQQVAVRLMVAGFDKDDFNVKGEPFTIVRFIRSDDLQRRIESKLEDELVRQFGVKQSDVQVSLSSTTVVSQISDAIDVSTFRVMAIFPSKLPLGQKTIQVEFIGHKGQRLTKRLNVQIVVMKEMVVTSGNVPRGTVITAEHVQSVKRPMAASNIELANMDCIGCTAIRDIPPYEIVSTRHITHKKPPNQNVVRQNSSVDILLSKGRVNIRMRNAKALKSGAVGETIPVLNTETNKTINAVVRDQSTVVVRN